MWLCPACLAAALVFALPSEQSTLLNKKARKLPASWSKLALGELCSVSAPWSPPTGIHSGCKCYVERGAAIKGSPASGGIGAIGAMSALRAEAEQ